MKFWHKWLTLTSLTLLLGSCAYYNTFYNAEEYFKAGQRLTQENQSETVTREEINLYSKSIEKSKKLLQRYPNSKYRDDAQFLIAKSYYYKGDFLLAKRYFDDLALNYPTSPHVEEVPLWIGRCLLEVGDLEMARHEASRIMKNDANRALQADALLLMGEIAVEQDSLDRAEAYLEQVISRSPDGYTKAQAQFQVGKMRENQLDYEGALKAYKAVDSYKPSESLRVESIIRQTTMLKALNRDKDAIAMIDDMLSSDKFVDIRGQLEVELGKLYLATGEIHLAESKFTSIIEEYSRQDVAAEASFYLGELHLTKTLNYQTAKEAYSAVKTQSARSPFVAKGGERLKQVERYLTLQFDFKNLERQLQGLAPVAKNQNADSKTRSRSSRARGRSRSTTSQAAVSSDREEDESQEDSGPKVVSHADSIRFMASMDENRYALAEYLLFDFARVDSSIDVLNTLERTSPDTSMRQQAAYMRYYAIDVVRGDADQGKNELAYIQQTYPAFYESISHSGVQEERSEKALLARQRLQNISALFDQGAYSEAAEAYKLIVADTTYALAHRSRASFNLAWLNDHFLFDKEAALSAYQWVSDEFPSDPLVETARKRMAILNTQSVESKSGGEAESQARDIQATPEDQQDAGRGQKPKDGEKDKDK